jgi:hypothetical protein
MLIRRYLYFLYLLLTVSSHIIFAQLQFKVNTDKQNYDFSEIINIYITAKNTTSENVELIFPSSCQTTYYIDDYDYLSGVPCLTVVTYVTILPDSEHTWSHQCSSSELLAGKHLVMGEVLEYGFTDTIEIFINSTSNIHEKPPQINNYILLQNYPNPFNPATNIAYSLSKSDYVIVKIYDMLGSEIQTLVNKYQTAGHYTVNFNARNLASGIYFYKLKVGNDIIQTKKMLLMR